MNVHFNRFLPLLRWSPTNHRSSFLALSAWLAIVPPAIAQNITQNPADLVPPAPDVYAVGNSGNSSLGASLTAQTIAGYRVFIPGNNPTIFEQAKAIEPTAFIQTIDGQPAIQVGLFGTEALALQQVARFQAQGMPVKFQPASQMATSSFPTQSAPLPIAAPPAPATYPPAPATYPPAPNYPAPNVPNYPGQLQVVNTVSPGYYVVIPIAMGDANYVQSQLNQLGIPPQYIFLRDRPFGIHYAIGTFTKRSEADRLSTIVRDRTKFDARVYHER
jgi:hypothetical protein